MSKAQIPLTMSQSRAECVSPKVVGANIRARRRSLDINQEDLGKAIGRDRHYVSRMESGQGVDFDLVPAIAQALKLDDPFKLLVPNAFI